MALSGHPNGQRLVRLVAELAKAHKAELIGVHVVEIDWSLPLDMDVAGRSEEIQRVLDVAEGTAEAAGVKLEPVLLQARDVGAALVDEAVEREADLLVVGPRLPDQVRRRLRHRPDDPVRPEERSLRSLGRARADPGGDQRENRHRRLRPRRRPSSPTRSTGPATRSSSSTPSTTAFDRLPGDFKGTAVRGDGTDEDTLRRAGAEAADLFIALTEGDNRNVMSAQLATEALDAQQVIAKINDPLRAERLRRARDRDALPDEPHGRRDQRASSASA